MTIEPAAASGLDLHLAELVAAHEQLDAMFLQHQLAVVRGDFELALRHYQAFCRQLLAHIEEEDSLVLPVYDRLERWEQNGRPELFRAEHHQLRLMLARTAAMLHEFEPSELLTPRDVIRVIEAEKPLKGVMEHHHCREQRYLYPGARRQLCRAGDVLRSTGASHAL